jgi:hypothetical protein
MNPRTQPKARAALTRSPSANGVVLSAVNQAEGSGQGKARRQVGNAGAIRTAAQNRERNRARAGPGEAGHRFQSGQAAKAKDKERCNYPGLVQPMIASALRCAPAKAILFR